MIRQFDKDLDKIHDVHNQVFSLYKCIGVLEESVRSFEYINKVVEKKVFENRDQIKLEVKRALEADDGWKSINKLETDEAYFKKGISKI